MTRRRKVVLVDGSWLAFRAFFALPTSLRTAEGLPTNAIYGFATMFRKLFTGKRPDAGAIVFDPPGPTTRELRFPAYKAHRPPTPRDLVLQWPHLERVARAHGFHVITVQGLEADDVIGTLAVRAATAGDDVVVVAGDKDMAQLVNEHVRLYDPMKDVTYDAELVKKRWGVPPARIPDRLALLGDDVDNIPGVNGIGEKGAVALLDKYGSLAGLYEHLDELKGKQKEALTTQREVAFASLSLATLDTAAEVPHVDLALPDVASEAVDALYRELEFFSLLTGGDPDDELPSVAVFDEARAAAALEALGDRRAVVVPLVDGTPGDERLVGIAVCAPGDEPWYTAGLQPSVAQWLADASRPKIVHDAKALWRAVSGDLAGVALDPMIASFLCDPTRHLPEEQLHGNPHRVEELAKDFAHRAVKPRKWLVGSGKELKTLADCPIDRCASYAGHLARVVADVSDAVRDRLASEGQTANHDDLELPLSWVLGRMELDGIRVDRDDLVAMGVEFTTKRTALEARAHALAGHPFNLGSTQQLAKVLFEELALPPQKKTKTGFSTDAEVLEKLVPHHEIAAVLLDHRAYAKLINTYVEVLLAAQSPRDGRVHPTFQQTVGVSGRLITTDPDLQRTPVRTIEGKRIRRAFIAEPGSVLVSADWSQIDLRVLAHFSRDPRLVEAFRVNADVHRRTAAELFGVAPEDVTSEQRNVGKTVNFATIYGQGATALSQQLGIPRKDAQAHIERYFATYAGVRAWLDRTIAEAGVYGFVTTLVGRRRYIPELTSRNAQERQAGERIAANTPIQGSAADLCKLAMLRIAKALDSGGSKARLVLQIHDELLLEVPEGEVDAVRALVVDAMEHPSQLEVPLVVNVGVGPSWAAAH